MGLFIKFRTEKKLILPNNKIYFYRGERFFTPTHFNLNQDATITFFNR
jgi:hypothetical protein